MLAGVHQHKPTTVPNYLSLAPLGHNGRQLSPAARPLINPDFNCTLLKALKRLQSGEQGKVNSADLNCRPAGPGPHSNNRPVCAAQLSVRRTIRHPRSSQELHWGSGNLLLLRESSLGSKRHQERCSAPVTMLSTGKDPSGRMLGTKEDAWQQEGCLGPGRTGRMLHATPTAPAIPGPVLAAASLAEPTLPWMRASTCTGNLWL